jgi:hypothetical protein
VFICWGTLSCRAPYPSRIELHDRLAGIASGSRQSANQQAPQNATTNEKGGSSMLPPPVD